jgi:hypothetical protein
MLFSFFHASYMSLPILFDLITLIIITMLSGSLVTAAWRVLGLRMEEKASRYGG